jgi:1,4-alpha-glucan branching enzyme
LNFTCNHDENKNAGSSYERLGAAHDAFLVLTFTIPGTPLIFGGQEAGLNRKLLFFDKDEIDWSKTVDYTPLYQSLVKLRKDNIALWSGTDGGRMKRIYTNRNDKVFAFYRENKGNTVLVIINFSHESIECMVDFTLKDQNFKNYFYPGDPLSQMQLLQPWSYKVFINQ